MSSINFDMIGLICFSRGKSRGAVAVSLHVVFNVLAAAILLQAQGFSRFFVYSNKPLPKKVAFAQKGNLWQKR